MAVARVVSRRRSDPAQGLLLVAGEPVAGSTSHVGDSDHQNTPGYFAIDDAEWEAARSAYSIRRRPSLQHQRASRPRPVSEGLQHDAHRRLELGAQPDDLRLVPRGCLSELVEGLGVNKEKVRACARH